MDSEIIRATPRWQHSHARYDTVLVQIGPTDSLMHGLGVGRVRAFFSFTSGLTRYDCALVEWFDIVGDEPDPLTGMWILKPEMHHGRRAVDVIDVDSIVRSCHLIGFFGGYRIPVDFHFSDALDTFHYFYLNTYIDYHTHELFHTF